MTLDDWKNIKVFDPPVKGTPEQHFAGTVKQDLDYGLSLCEVDGLYLEFGVFKGTTINHCSSKMRNKIFYGFDSFEGLPEDWDLVGDTGHDISKIQVKEKGHFAVDKLPKVNDNVRLIKGFFDESLQPWIKENLDNDSKISWLHLDADLYSSTIYVLEALNNYIVPGTIIRFDELVEWRLEAENTHMKDVKAKPKAKYADWRNGEWKALNQWMEQYDRQVEPMWRNWHQGAGVKVIG